MRTSLLFLFVAFALIGIAQSASPSVIGTSGGSGVVTGITIEQTVGEVMVSTVQSGGIRLTQGFHQAEPVRMRANIRAFLQGPYDPGTGLMSDGLRSLGLVPLIEPYSALGLPQIGSGGEQTTPVVLTVTAQDAIVDWVHLELRDKNNAATIVATRNALVQADGDIVDVDGHSPVAFVATTDDYFISVHHRNHLGVMSLSPVHLTTTAAGIDFTDGSSPTYGIGAQASVSAVQMLWAGDVNGDGLLKYTGSNNDRGPIFLDIGGVVPTNTVTGYLPTDVDLDGTIKYTGTNNDRDPILVNIGGVVPTNVRQAQLP